MLTRYNNDWNSLARAGSRNDASFDTWNALRKEVNRLLFDFESGLPDVQADASWPRATFEDNGSAFVLRLEVPGVDEKAIELSADEGTVTLKGERRDVAPEGYSVHRKERAAFRFARSFRLPAKADPEKVEAVVKHGVLTVTLQKAKEAQPRQISVRAS